MTSPNLSMKKLFDFDPYTGIKTIYHDRPEVDGFTLEYVQDTEGYIQRNKAFDGDGYTPSRDLQHVATIPLSVLHLWSVESGVSFDDPAFGDVVKRRLNDPDLKYFRTGKGRI